MNLTVMRNHQQVYTREQPLAALQLTQDISRQYGMTVEDAETAKRAGDLPEGMRRSCCIRLWKSL